MNKKIIIILVIIVSIVVVLLTGNNKFESNKTYIDNIEGFSIDLPKGWTLMDKSISSTTSSNTLFANSSSTIVIKRFSRTESVEQAIRFMGNFEFLVFIADGLKDEIADYSIVATSSLSINNVDYYRVMAKYIAPNSKKEVTQYVYIGLTDKNYYLLGVDVYSEIWAKEKDPILDSVSTFKLSP